MVSTETLKKVFPKPKLPQKRYLIIIAIILYVALKIYVAYTPGTYDDKILDDAQAIAIQILADGEPIDIGVDEQKFGESA